MCRFLSPLIVALGAAGLLGGPAAPVAHAQAVGAAFTFEEVGDRPLDAEDIAFDEAGTLWAISSDVWRLPEGATDWEEVATVSATSNILPLRPDTLLIAWRRILRSPTRRAALCG